MCVHAIEAFQKSLRNQSFIFPVALSNGHFSFIFGEIFSPENENRVKLACICNTSLDHKFCFTQSGGNSE